MERSPAADESDVERLADLRAGLRRYLAWAEQCAREHDTTPAQVQLALAIRAHPSPNGPRISDLADTLLLRHHSVVGLIDRAEQAGLVTRQRDPDVQTVVHVRLTDAGHDQLTTITALHTAWLRQHSRELVDVLAFFDQAVPDTGDPQGAAPAAI